MLEAGIEPRHAASALTSSNISKEAKSVEAKSGLFDCKLTRLFFQKLIAHLETHAYHLKTHRILY